MNGHEVSGGDGGVVVGGAAPAAGGTVRRGKEDPLLQQALNFINGALWNGRLDSMQPRVAGDVVHVHHMPSCATAAQAVHKFRGNVEAWA